MEDLGRSQALLGQGPAPGGRIPLVAAPGRWRWMRRAGVAARDGGGTDRMGWPLPIPPGTAAWEAAPAIQWNGRTALSL